jgi:hypothetical protein
MAYYGLSPRIKRYDSLIRAEAPTARNRFFRDQSFALDQKNRDLSRQALDQSRDQFNQQLALSQEQADAQGRQADTANLISTAALAKTAYPYAKKAVSYGIDKASGLFSTGEPAASTAAFEPQVPYSYNPVDTTPFISDTAGAASAAPIAYEASAAPTFAASSQVAPYAYNPVTESLFSEAAAPAYGAGEAAIPTAAGSAAGSTGVGEGAGAAAGGGLSWWGGPVIAAATLGQLAAAKSSPNVEGEPVTHAFSFRDGNFSPGLAEPDKQFFSEQWGGGNTIGARFDARRQKGDTGGAIRALPGFVQGYAFPGADVVGNVAGGYASRQGGDTLGRVASTVANPSTILAPGLQPIAEGLSESKDIGDAAATVLSGGVINDSHFCTLIDKKIGTTRKEKLLLKSFKDWSEKNRPGLTKYYDEYMGKVADIIDKTIGDNDSFYASMKDMLITRVIDHMQHDDMEAAFDQYFQGGMKLIKEFAPELEPFIAKAEMPGE